MYENQVCVLIADDEVRITKALKDFFRVKNYHVYIANDGQEALDIYYANNEKIDAVILDIMMPKVNGIEVLRDIRESNKTVPVIMLTAKAEEYDQLIGFKCGADDYVTKPFSPSILLARIENVLKRVNKTTIETISVGGIDIDVGNYTIKIDKVPIEMTRREFDLISYLASNPNLALDREQLLNNVWGYNFDGDSRTIDTHIKQLRIKLGDKAKYIKTIHRVGYMFEVK